METEAEFPNIMEHETALSVDACNVTKGFSFHFRQDPEEQRTSSTYFTLRYRPNFAMFPLSVLYSLVISTTVLIIICPKIVRVPH